MMIITIIFPIIILTIMLVITITKIIIITTILVKVITIMTNFNAKVNGVNSNNDNNNGRVSDDKTTMISLLLQK